MRKITYALSIITILVISGCSTTDEDNGIDSEKAVSQYIDSEVSNMSYICGKYSGKTTKEGLFNFEEGKNCKFKLSEIDVKEVQSKYLRDGRKLFENNIWLARILQALDKDKNLENGIQIDDNIVALLKQSGIEKFPGTEADFEEIKQVLDTINIKIPSNNEACSHLRKYNPNSQCLLDGEDTPPENAVDCEKYPTNIKCDIRIVPVDCEEDPDDPLCNIEEPPVPPVKDFCDIYPDDPTCKDK